MPPARLADCRFGDLPGWGEGDLGPALAAFRRSAERLCAGRVRTGALGVEADALRPAAAAALAGAHDPRRFFETHFRPARLQPLEGADAGFLTGYYEPEAAASPVPTPRYRFPLYRPPADLVPVEAGGGHPGLDPAARFARRRADGGLEPYPDRAAIEAGCLAGQGLEIAWLDSAVEAFVIHVQGSARLRMTDGTTRRVTYAAKSGHPFTGIGRLLVADGALTQAEADMDGIRAWLARHPERMAALFARNRSFIFFREAEALPDDAGPIGAAKVPLTAMASIAVDRALHTFGTPVYLDAPTLRIADAPLRCLTIAQDTGSAIVGPARADLFIGSGAAAGAVAGRIRHPAALFVLRPVADGRAFPA